MQIVCSQVCLTVSRHKTVAANRRNTHGARQQGAGTCGREQQPSQTSKIHWHCPTCRRCVSTFSRISIYSVSFITSLLISLIRHLGELQQTLTGSPPFCHVLTFLPPDIRQHKALWVGPDIHIPDLVEFCCPLSLQQNVGNTHL